MGCTSSKKVSKSEDSRSALKPVLGGTLCQGDNHLVDPGDRLQGPVSGLNPTLPTMPSGSSSATTLPMTESPVARLLQGKKTMVQTSRETAEIKEEEDDDDAKLEAPALRIQRKTSLDRRIEAEMSRHRSVPPSSSLISPQIRDISGVKGTFDKNKFKKANETSLPPFSNLPLTVQDRLDEIQLFGTIAEKPTMKPLSTLTLPAALTQTSKFTGSGKPVLVRPAASDPKIMKKSATSPYFVHAEISYDEDQFSAK